MLQDVTKVKMLQDTIKADNEKTFKGKVKKSTVSALLKK
jgi:hypothetical protein